VRVFLWAKFMRFIEQTQHFSQAELASPDTGEAKMQPEFMLMLEALRRDYGKPMIITSGYRTPEHNAAVGGAKRSYHLQGRAVDVQVFGAEAYQLVKLAMRHGFGGIGIQQQGAMEGRFIHLDNREGDPVIFSY